MMLKMFLFFCCSISVFNINLLKTPMRFQVVKTENTQRNYLVNNYLNGHVLAVIQQTIFDLESGVERPIRLPTEVLRRIISSGNIPIDCKQKLVKQCFVGSKINLNRDKRSDIVVMGQSKMLGANTTTFWIFIKDKDTYNLVLKTTAMRLEIGPTKTRGALDIVGVFVSAGSVTTNVFDFDGRKYKLASQTHEKI